MKATVNKGTRFLAYSGIFVALTMVITAFVKIPFPRTNGYINIGDAVIFVCAYMCGGFPAMIAGGLGSAFADLLAGYSMWAPFSLAIKGVEGLLCGILCELIKKRFKGRTAFFATVAAFVAAGIEMVAGYFFASWILYGVQVAALEILLNLIQAGVSATAAVALVSALRATKIIKIKETEGMGLGEKLLDFVWNTAGKNDAKRMAKQEKDYAAQGVIKNGEYGGTRKIADIPYINDGDTDHLLDIYYPEAESELYPVIMDIHGGGWCYGNKELNENFCKHLAMHGFAVVNVNYRLLPKAGSLLEQLKDVVAALNWISGSDAEYKLDKGNVFTVGDSAGGHLNSLLMALTGNPELREEWGVAEITQKISAGALVCPALEFGGFLKIRNPVVTAYGKMFLGEGFRKNKWLTKISLSGAYKENYPPIYAVSCKGDFIRSQTIKLQKWLQENKIPSQVHIWEKSQNKLTHVFNVLYPDWEESVQTNGELCDFFKSHIK